MLRRLRAAAVASMLALLGSTADAADPVVAVFNIDAPDIDPKLATALTDYLRGLLSQGRGMTIVDKGQQEAQLKKLIDEQKKASYKACVDEACQIPLGKELAANQVLRTKLLKVGKIFVLQSELIDVASAASIGGATVKTSGSEEELLIAVEQLVDQLTSASAVVSAREPAFAGSVPLAAPSGPTALVVDLQKLIMAHPEGQRARQALRRKKAILKAELERDEQALAELRRQAAGARGRARRTLVRKLRKQEEALQRRLDDLQSTIGQQEQGAIADIVHKLDASLAALAQRVGAPLVVEAQALLYADPRLDCTSAVAATPPRPCAGVRAPFIAVVDPGQIIQRDPAARGAKAKLKAAMAEAQAALDEQQRRVEALGLEHISYRPQLDELHRAFTTAQSALSTEDQRAFDQLRARMTAWAQQQGIHLLLDGRHTLYRRGDCTDAFLGRTDTCVPLRADHIQVVDLDAVAQKRRKTSNKERKKLKNRVKKLLIRAAPRRDIDLVLDAPWVAYAADGVRVGEEALRRLK